MRSCSPNPEQRRARPLLGTFVEVRVDGMSAAAATVAFDRAFGAVARVQTLMSPREPSSDVARLNRAAPAEIVRVDPWTLRVLAAAQQLSALSDGIFDVTAAPGDGNSPRRSRTDWRDLALLSGHRVRCRRSFRLDLGGIAKGFAVDRAVEVLREVGAVAGVVNAGGDLRVFGSTAERVHVRHPAVPATLVPVADLVEEALATSANYLDAPGVGRLMHPGGGRLWLGSGSVSVRAPSCLLADALCKVVAAIGPRRAAALLAACGASALVLSRRGRVWQKEFAQHEGAFAYGT